MWAIFTAHVNCAGILTSQLVRGFSQTWQWGLSFLPYYSPSACCASVPWPWEMIKLKAWSMLSSKSVSHGRTYCKLSNYLLSWGQHAFEKWQHVYLWVILCIPFSRHKHLWRITRDLTNEEFSYWKEWTGTFTDRTYLMTHSVEWQLVSKLPERVHILTFNTY